MSLKKEIKKEKLSEEQKNEYYNNMLRDYNNENYIKELGLKYPLEIDLKYSLIQRHMLNIKYMYSIKRFSIVNSCITCFKVMGKGTNCIYGYLFTDYIIPDKKKKKKEGGELLEFSNKLTENIDELSEQNSSDEIEWKIVDDNEEEITGGDEYDNKLYKHQYYVFGPTFTSQDGEYRPRIVPYKCYEKLKEYFSATLDIVERFVIDQMESKVIELYCDIYLPDDLDIDRRKFTENINRSRFAIKLFMLCVIYDSFNIVNNLEANHIYPAFELIFGSLPNLNKLFINLKKSLKLVKTINTNMDEDEKYDRFMIEITSPNILVYPPLSKTLSPPLSMGIKFIPMKVREAQQIGNIVCNTWKEYYINYRLSELVLNSICPCFSVVSGWMIIQNTDDQFYDGYSMAQKHRYSRLANSLIDDFKASKKKVKHPEKDTLESIKTKNISTLDEKMKKIVDKQQVEKNNMETLNGYFEELADRMTKDILYTNTYIRLSGLTLGMPNENMGRTLLDLDKMLIMRNYYQIHELFKSKEIFDSVFFSFLYTIYIMNSRMFISHNDLHLNNMTLYKLIHLKLHPDDVMRRPVVINPHILYILDDETQFLVQNVGYHIGLIDFSRGLIGKEELIKEFLPETYSQLIREQRERFAMLIERKYPKFGKENKDKIMSVLYENMYGIFKITTAFDIMDLCMRLQTIVTSLIKPEFVKPEIKEYIDKILLETDRLVLGYLTQAVKRKLNYEEIDFPALTMMKSLYGNKLYSSDEEIRDKLAIKKKDANGIEVPAITLIDVYNNRRDLKYTVGRDKDMDKTIPVWIGLEKEEEIREELDMERDDIIDEWREYCMEERNVDMVAPLLRKFEHEVSDVGLGSSWLV